MYLLAKMRVAVIFGGASSEHDISCISASAVAEALDADKYEVYKIGITQRGRWLLYPGGTEGMCTPDWHENPDVVPAILSPDRTTRGIITSIGGSFDVIKIDLAFPVLHGRNGEDGTVQGLLEMAGIPYVGCGVLASAACMDKAFANRIFDATGIAHTPWLVADRRDLFEFDQLLFKISEKLSFPLFVKPAVGGSSIGITKVKDSAELRAAVQLASAHDNKILFEQAVVGREVECAVLGNHDPDATLPGEVVSCNEIYDYEAKYRSDGGSKLHLPAPLGEEKLKEVRAMALRAYEALGCEGLSRVDFFVEEGSERVLLNEINTMPGFTSISMYSKLWEMTGLAFPDLCDRLVALALERAEG